MVKKTPPKQKMNPGETALRESEERYRLFQGILRSSSDGILAVNRENEVLYANERFVEMWMIPQEVMAGKDDTLLIQYVLDQLFDPQGFLQKIQELYNSAEESFDTLYFKDGRVFDRLSRPMLQETELRGRVWSFRDITKSKRAEEALRESEERYRSLFDRMLDGVYRSTHEGKFVDVNPAMVKMFGYSSKEEMLEVDIKKELYFAPDERGSHILDTGREEVDVYRMRRKDGSEIWVEDHGFYIHDKQGRIIYHEGMLRDITGRKQIEDELAASEAELRALFASMHDVVLVIDREGVYRKIAPTNRALLVKPPEELLGKNLKDVFPAEKAEVFRGVMQQVLDTKQNAQIEYELIITGRTVWFQATISPLDVDSTLWVAHDITNRKQAEEALKESRDRLEATLNALPDLMFEVDSDGLIFDFRAPNPELLYAPPKEFLGKTMSQVVPPDASDVIQEAINQAAEKGTSFAGVYSLRLPQGISWFELSVARRGNGSMPDTRFVVLVRDITDRKQAEEALRASEKKYKAMVQNIPGMVYRANPDWTAEIVSNAVGLCGYENDEINSMPRGWLNIVHPDDRDVVEREGAALARERHAIVQPYRIIAKNGQTRWVEDHKTSFFSEAGVFEGIEGVVLDITERKQAEEALRQAEAKYRNIFENAIEGIFQTVPSGKFFTANPALASMLGYDSPEEMVADVKDLTHEFYEQPARREEFMRQLNDYGMISNFESKVYRKDGRTIWISENARAVRDDAGQVLHYEGTLIDITERKRAEMERQALLEIMQGLASTKDLQEFLELIRQSINKVIPAENYSVVLYNKETELFEEVYAVDKYDPPMPPSKLEKSITSYVFRTAESLLLNQERFDELAARGEVKLVGTNSACWLGAPLRKPAETFGVIAIQDYENPNCYSGRDKDFLTFIGAQVALAIERKHAEEEVRRAKDDLETTNLELQQSLEREKLMACTDGLTGLYNHRYIFELAAREFQAAIRHRRPLTFLMFDMDDFKQVNDTLGHTAGDKLLVMVAQTVVAQVRASDVVARYGGDEFIVMLPQASAQQALPIAERIRASVAAIRVDAFRDDKEPFVITLSIGIAEMRHEPVDENVERVIQRADEAMYKAKQSGRNRIVIFDQK